MKQLTDRQKDAAKRIYDSCIWFLSEFYNSDGFNMYWWELEGVKPTMREDRICEMVEGKMNRVRMVVDQEYFDLGRHEIYNEFCEFVNEDLMDIYGGKLSYGYRFEALVDGNPSTMEDYSRALKSLNHIVEKYL